MTKRNEFKRAGDVESRLTPNGLIPAAEIIRVSRARGREETILSPDQQRERNRQMAAQHGLEIVRSHVELDVSGGTPLVKRKGLRVAVEEVEAGDVRVIVSAYFDRLVRSLKVQEQILERVHEAGGRLLTGDLGWLRDGSAAEWASITAMGTMNEFVRRRGRDSAREAHVGAIAAGIPPYPFDVPGYARTSDRRVVVNEDEAPVVVEAFELRAAGAAIAAVREHLGNRGIERSYRQLQELFKNRAVLGELHFGRNYEPNLTAWPAIIPHDLFDAVQRVKVSRGRRAKSDELLARLGVLRCGSCGRRMVVGHAASGHAFYRCPALRKQDCPKRAHVSSRIAERVVKDAVQKKLNNARGVASALSQAREDAVKAEAAAEEYEGVLRAFTAASALTEPGAVENLTGLKRKRDEARERAARSASRAGTRSLAMAKDAALLTMAEWRDLIVATVESVTVGERGVADRVEVKLFGE